MAEMAKVHTDRLKELKGYVEEAQQYFDENVQRYEKFVKFVFKTSLKDDEAATLAATGKPTIEFNIMEAFISKQRGEFSKQQPNLTVRAADGVPASMLDKQFSETLDLTEAHLRTVFFDGANDMLDYNVYSDLLAGGFSVLKVYTDYVNEFSFEQNIYVERVFEPTLTFFDPLARESHKGDGRYCGELYPMTKKRFEEEFGEYATSDMQFTRNLSGFDWSYQNEKEKIVLVCDLYEKKRKKETIYRLSNGESVTRKKYDKILEEWHEQGKIEQPPIILDERRTVIETIVRYRFCENRILDYTETNFKHFPLVFVDGNSVMIKESGSYTQMTRPYIYHGEGIQRLKNFAGQSLANELENTIQHKFIAAIEAIPKDATYQDAYNNVQKADVLVYNHFLDTQRPEITLPPPSIVARTPIPPEITNTFKAADEMMQMILGSFDNQGVSRANLSGVAIARNAIQSNNSSVPYVVGFIKGLNRVAQIIVDLIPKYYRTPRSLPILRPDGKRDYVEINKKGSLYMNFDPNHLQVKVEAGVNYAMQKEIALQTVIAMSQANQGFAQFFNEQGLPVLLDNIDIRGIDQLKQKAADWMQQQQQQKAQQSQVAQQQMQMQTQQQQMQMQQQKMQIAGMQKDLNSPTDGQVGAMMVQQQVQKDSAEMAIKSQQAETNLIEAIAKINNMEAEQEIKRAKIEAEQTRSTVDSLLKIGQHINSTIAKE